MRDTMLIIHFIGLAMGLGTSFANMFIGMASAKMEQTEAMKFRMNAMVISRMGHIGLGLLIISGIFLMTPYWNALTETPLLMLKLLLVVLLTTLVWIITTTANKLKRGDPTAKPQRLEPLGKTALVTALIIVVLAVMIFH